MPHGAAATQIDGAIPLAAVEGPPDLACSEGLERYAGVWALPEGGSGFTGHHCVGQHTLPDQARRNGFDREGLAHPAYIPHPWPLRTRIQPAAP